LIPNICGNFGSNWKGDMRIGKSNMIAVPSGILKKENT
jgi:hypothetical protein